MSTRIAQGPVRLLAAWCGFIGALWLWAVTLMIQQPWIGLELGPDGEAVRILAAPRHAAIRHDSMLVALARPGGEEFVPRARDLIEEPDFFDTYPEMAEFFARQGVLRKLLDGTVELRWRDAVTEHITRVQPDSRPLDTLPATFWFQLACGGIASVIGLWVWLLRPDAASSRMLAITGLSYLLITTPAAIYSSRELALDAGLFRALAAANHLGAISFGCGLIALMLSYPRMLGSPRRLLLPFAIYLPWWLADTLRLAPDQDWGSRIPVMSQMCIAIAIGLVQWRRARGDPRARAALRWVLLSVLVGSGLFVFIVVGSQLLGSFAPLPQGYALGFFLLMFVGLAAGVGRYRLFDLDKWAYRVLLWVGGAMLVLAIDATLISLLRLTPESALAIALLAGGWLYFPLRQWLLTRLTRAGPPAAQALADVLSLALATEPGARGRQWQHLMESRFRPARIERIERDEGGVPRLLDDGLALEIPAHNGCPALLLHLRDDGRSLFSSEDAAFAQGLMDLLAQTLVRRSALDEATRAERQRIGQDLHDDLGSRLLMIMHRSRDADLSMLAREAMADLRSILAALEGPGALLEDVIADCRSEAMQRCEVAGTSLQWAQAGDVPATWLGSQACSALRRCTRELVTNALKHARPEAMVLDVACDAERLRISLSHALPPGVPETWQDGRGLRGIRSRLASLAGRFEVEHPRPGVVTTVIELGLDGLG